MPKVSRDPAVMRELLATNLFAVVFVALCLTGVVVALHLCERTASRVVARHWGWRGVLVTGWIGVPLHELSHLFVAKLFGHRVVNWSLFDPDPRTGTLGYVHHAHSKRSTWQLFGNFWIGIAPILAGGAVLAWLCAKMAPGFAWREMWELEVASAAAPRAQVASAFAMAMRVAREIWQARNAWLPLYLYLAIAVACHMAPSRPDLRSALGGFTLGISLLLVLAVIGALCGMSLARVVIFVPAALLLLLAVASFLGLWVLVVRLTRAIAA